MATGSLEAGSAPSAAPASFRRATHRLLDTGWTLETLVARDRAPHVTPIDAVVPGRVLADLAAAGIEAAGIEGAEIEAAGIEAAGIEGAGRSAGARDDRFRDDCGHDHGHGHGHDHDHDHVGVGVGVGWVDACDWRYAIDLDLEPERRHDHVELICDGLDALATVSLDDQLIGVSTGMHRRLRFDLPGGYVTASSRRDQTGDDGSPAATPLRRLTVDFASTSRHAAVLRARENERPSASASSASSASASSSSGVAWTHVRTLAGADPAGPTTGIWRPVRLHAWSGARLGDIVVHPTVDDHDLGEIAVTAEVVGSHLLRRTLDARLELQVVDATGTVVAAGSIDVSVPSAASVTVTDTLHVGGVQRWWPRSLGRPTCYRVAVRLVADDVELDRWSATVGFRTVDLDTAADGIGSAFAIVVNGVASFIRGVAWTPLAPMPPAAARTFVRRRLRDAAAANVDLVRVWGGGVYESDDFYDACDELGLLVWQDLPFVGAAYPERLLRDEVLAETRDNVMRLHHHPCLALWNGNDGGHLVHRTGHDDGGGHDDSSHDDGDALPHRASGHGFWTEDVPMVLDELDPSRPWWPGSPFSGPHLPPDADLHGTTHLWTGWDDPAGHARRRAPRFVAALGVRAARTASAPDTLTDELALDQALRRAFGQVPRDPVTHARACEVLVARVARSTIEHLRSLRGHTMGSIWWQLFDDGGPGNGGLVDRDGHRRPVWHAVRDAFTDRLATIQPRGHELVLHLVNDGANSWWARGRVERITLDGCVRIGQEVDVVVPARSVARLSLDPCVASPRDPADEVVVADVGQTTAWWWFVDDVRLRAAARRLAVDVRRGAAGRLQLGVASATVVRDLVVDTDVLRTLLGPSAVADRQLVSVRPGRPETFTVDGVDPSRRLAVDPVALFIAPVRWATAARHAGD